MQEVGTTRAHYLILGTYTSRPVYETSEADFDKCIDLNLRSIFHSVHTAFPELQKAREKGLPAAVVNISSTGGVKGRPGLTWYSASKAAANSVTQSLAQEFANDQIVSKLAFTGAYGNRG
jgi:3-oxoacyl-[acyl-carrier protein] reductase